MRAMRVQLAGLAETVRTLDHRVSRLAEQFAAGRADEPPIAEFGPGRAASGTGARRGAPRAGTRGTRRHAAGPGSANAGSAGARSAGVFGRALGTDSWSRTGWSGWAARRWRSAAHSWSSCRSITACLPLRYGSRSGCPRHRAVGAAEWLRRRETPEAGRPRRAVLCPPSAGRRRRGDRVCRRSLPLTALRPAPGSIAFVLLAITAGGAVAQALRQGRWSRRSGWSAPMRCRCWSRATRRMPCRSLRI